MSEPTDQTTEDRSSLHALFGAESEHRRAESLAKTVGWLIENMDRIHAALCPGQHGIWQERVRQAVAAAEKAPNKELPNL
jgi:hypothetical protein